MIVLDSTIMNIAAGAGGIKVERQHPASARSGIEDRHRTRLARRLIGQPASMPRGVSAAAVARDPDVQRSGQPRRHRPPRRRGALRRFGGVRELVTTR
jgi:hypothetical protein